jgi:hypothetical protein
MFLPDSTVLGSRPSRPPCDRTALTAGLASTRTSSALVPIVLPAAFTAPGQDALAAQSVRHLGAGKRRLVGRQRRPGTTLRALQLGSVPRLAGPIEGRLAVLEGSRDQGGERLEILRVRMAHGFHSESSQRRGTARNRWDARSPESSSVAGWSLLEMGRLRKSSTPGACRGGVG